MGPRLFWKRLSGGGNCRCAKCGKRFGKNETKHFSSDDRVTVNLGRICGECKSKEG